MHKSCTGQDTVGVHVLMDVLVHVRVLYVDVLASTCTCTCGTSTYAPNVLMDVFVYYYVEGACRSSTAVATERYSNTAVL